MITNFGFHLLSLFALAGLLFVLVRLMGALRLSLLLSRSAFGSKQTVLIDWPLSFVARASRVVGVPFSCASPKKALKPRRLDLQAWALLVLTPELKSIAVVAGPSVGERPIMRMAFNGKPHTRVLEAVQRLQQDFANELIIEPVY